MMDNDEQGTDFAGALERLETAAEERIRAGNAYTTDEDEPEEDEDFACVACSGTTGHTPTCPARDIEEDEEPQPHAADCAMRFHSASPCTCR